VSDWLPTLLEMIDADPEDLPRDVDGISQVHFLNSAKTFTHSWRTNLFYHISNRTAAYRFRL